MKVLRSGADDFQASLNQIVQRRWRTMSRLTGEVDGMIASYLNRRDEVLVEQARAWDHADLIKDDLWISDADIKNAHKFVSAEMRKVIDDTRARIEKFQSELKVSEMQSQEEEGVHWGTCLRPLDRVGIYVPGGRAPFFLTLLFAAVPARLAGVKEIVVATPPRKKIKAPFIDPLVLYVAKLMKISEVLVAGGPAALAAMAFGTENSRPVQKIFGSGGHLTQVAKMRLQGWVDVDHYSGPSETAFICDKTANANVIAADILNRIDRDPEAEVYVFHSDDRWLRSVVDQLANLVDGLKDVESKKSVERALETHCFFFVVKNLDEAFKYSSQIAPGALCLHIKSPADYLDKVSVCGSVYLGAYTPPGSVDIIGGAVGISPTLGGAQTAFSVSPAAFMRRFSYVEITQDALERSKAASSQLSDLEGFSSYRGALNSRV